MVKVPASGGECVLFLLTVRLTGTVPATKAVLLVLGSGVVFRYRLI